MYVGVLPGDEALYGYQETLNEYIAGEALLANQTLLQGLRSRYPRQSDPVGLTQTALLELSAQRFVEAVEVAGAAVGANPDGFRAGGLVNPDFPFFVENAPVGGQALGEIVESEYFRYTDLVNRYGIAGNALAKRKFFFGNDDLASRADAAFDFKTTAQGVHLSAILLAAGQSAREFQDNNGGELDRQVTIAQQLYDDIQSGFNPLTLRGDFLPSQSLDGIFDFAETQLRDAVCSEIAARDAARLYDEDQTALVQELRDQTENYLDQIEVLLGFKPPFPRPGDTECDPPEQLACDFTQREHRDRLLAIARDRDADGRDNQRSIDYLGGFLPNGDPVCDATICNNYRNWEATQLELRQAQDDMDGISALMEIEEERSGEITRIIGERGRQISGVEVAQGLAVAYVPDVGSGGDLTFQASAAIAATFDAGITRLEALRDIEIEESESAATMGNLLLELGTAQLSYERTALAVNEARAEYTASIGDLVRFLRNFAASREELAEAYFTNPAYQVALERAAQNAERNFEGGMVAAYRTAKALEYEWAERLSNPVLDPDGPDRPIGDVAEFDPIVSAESVFTVRSAGSPELPAPTLSTYVQALQAWDGTMRDVRGPHRQEGHSVVVSLKRDILGFDSPDEAFNRIAFRSHGAARRVPGLNPAKPDLVIGFPLQILDQRLLPAQPNLKIQNLQVDLKTVPGRLLREEPSPDPPLVDLLMEDQALLRTFFARFPEDDDFLTIDLEGSRSFRQSEFFAQVEATIDGEGRASPNVQLATRSPAVSRWVLGFQMDNGVNRGLVLENLDDIAIRITYSFGHPNEDFAFPDLMACP
jgi:hypothetical protein